MIYPVLPVIADALEIGEGSIGLLITAFTLPAVFLAPIGGMLIDLRGRKQVLVASLLLYGIAGGAIVAALVLGLTVATEHYRRIATVCRKQCPKLKV